MPDYREVFQVFELDQRTRDCAFGRIALPTPTLTPAFPSAGFPPALVPFWSRPTDLATDGHWLHPLANRSATIVRCAPEDGFAVTEVARTSDQAFAALCLTLLSVFDGPTPELEHFSEQVDIDLAALNAVSLEVGDDPARLVQYPPFRDDPPLAYAQHDMTRYRGDFPSSHIPLTAESLRRLCGLEVDSVTRDAMIASGQAPPWLIEAHMPGLFDRLLSDGDLAGAWMTLNSPGWTRQEAREALAGLADRVGEDRLSVLASAWIAEPHPLPGY